MNEMLTGIKMAMLGGDARETVLLKELLRLGGEVKVAGLPVLPELEKLSLYHSPTEALREAEVVILPVPGINNQGVIYAPGLESPLYLEPELARLIPPGTPVIVGLARQALKEIAQKFGWRLIATAEMDEMAILNSVPTAEGAVMIAIRELPITIHGSEAFVLGLGRTGMTMARTLKGLGARVTAIDRGKEDRARAFCEGWRAYPFTGLGEIIGEADVIFNTVPAVVLTEDLLKQTKPEVLIIDLASDPGGTDFKAAEGLKRKAILALGLPGKIAPITAGNILAQVYPPIITQCLGRL